MRKTCTYKQALKVNLIPKFKNRIFKKLYSNELKSKTDFTKRQYGMNLFFEGNRIKLQYFIKKTT